MEWSGSSSSCTPAGDLPGDWVDCVGDFSGTANFVFGGRATYQQMLAVWFYGTLPLAVISILTMVTVFAGISGDSFNIRNTVGTNVGFYLMYGDTPQWLVTLLSSVDIISIWAAVLLTMGSRRWRRLRAARRRWWCSGGGRSGCWRRRRS